MADDTPETSFELTSQTEGPFFNLTVRTLTPFSTDPTRVPSPSSFLFFFFPLFHFLFDAGVAFGAVLWQLLSRRKSAFQRSFIFPFVSRQPYSNFKPTLVPRVISCHHDLSHRRLVSRDT